MIITLVLLCVIATVAFPGKFATSQNLSQILLNLSIDTIVAVGMMVLMIAGVFDLSVGSIVAFSGGLAGYLMYYHNTYFLLAVGVALAGSVLIGWLNGYLVAKIGINPLIQTLAMMGVVRGITLMLSGSGIQNFPYKFIFIGQSKFLGLQAPIWYMLVTLLIFSFLMNNSAFFRQYYFLGSNEKAAFLSGMRVDRLKIWVFVLSAFLAGLAGILLTSRLDAALSTSGKGLELRVITAVILGGASLQGGQGKIWGAFLGAAFMGVINNILIISRVSGYWQEVILGLILIIAVGADSMVSRGRGEGRG